MPKQVPPDEYKLQIRIPYTLYQRMLNLTEYGDSRIYGGLTKLTILALQEYLAKFQPAKDKDI